MTISIIIVNYNGLHFTRQCIESFYRFHETDSAEVIIVDNNSTDGSQDKLRKLFPAIHFIELSENRGFGVANNAGAKEAKGEILFFVNNDTLFVNEVLTGLKHELISNSHYAVVAPKLLNEDRSNQVSYGEYPSISNERDTKKKSDKTLSQLHQIANSDPSVIKPWVTGAAMMVKRAMFDLIGGFDEEYFMYFEDIDLCATFSHFGYASVYVPSVQLVHLGGKSYQKQDEQILFEYRRSQIRYYDKHASLLQRSLVRMYVAGKYLPLIFISKKRKLAKNVLFSLFRIHHRVK